MYTLHQHIMLSRHFVCVTVVSERIRFNIGIILNIASCSRFVRNTSGKLDLVPPSHIGEKVLWELYFCHVTEHSSCPESQNPLGNM